VHDKFGQDVVGDRMTRDDYRGSRGAAKDWFPEIDPKNWEGFDFEQPIIEPPRLPVPKEVFPNAERVLADWLAPNRSDSND